jgi:hypothetical protein
MQRTLSETREKRGSEKATALILSPAQNPDEQTKILTLASRAPQSRHLRQNLQSGDTPDPKTLPFNRNEFQTRIIHPVLFSKDF